MLSFKQMFYASCSSFNRASRGNNAGLELRKSFSQVFYIKVFAKREKSDNRLPSELNSYYDMPWNLAYSQPQTAPFSLSILHVSVLRS